MEALGISPRFSIIIPTYARVQTLRACLSGCCALDYHSGQFEIVVVDDGDDEGTRQVVADFLHLIPLVYIPQPARSGPASARNAGAAAARGRYVVFIDDDCVPDKGWLKGMDEVLDDAGPPLLAGGRIENDSSENVFAIASQNLVEFLYEWYNADPRNARFFASNNIACPKAAFAELGGFDASFPRAAAEDRDFCDRWRERGWRLVSAPNAVVRHRHRLTFRSFVRQHFGYGRGAVYLHQGRERRGVRRPKLEPLRFYYRLLAYPMQHRSEASRPQLVALAFASQVAYAAGFYRERLRARRLALRSSHGVHTPVDVRQQVDVADPRTHSS